MKYRKALYIIITSADQITFFTFLNFLGGIEMRLPVRRSNIRTLTLSLLSYVLSTQINTWVGSKIGGDWPGFEQETSCSRDECPNLYTTDAHRCCFKKVYQRLFFIWQSKQFRLSINQSVVHSQVSWWHGSNCGVYGLEVKCSASHAKCTGFEPRSVHACFSVIRPTVLIFPSSLHVKDPLLVPELGQSSKITKIKCILFGIS